MLPALSSPFIIPPGNVCRFVCSTEYSRKQSPAPFSSDTLLIDNFSPLTVLLTHSFILPSVCSKSGWCKRRLSSDELLLLWDYPPLLFRKIKGKDRKRLLAWNGPPSRVLGHMLRRFLNIKRGTVGLLILLFHRRFLERW